MKWLKPVFKGKVLRRIYTAECRWCLIEEDPAPKHICGKCYKYFSSLLTSYRWTQYRKHFLAMPENGWCIHCHAETGAIVHAKIVDHIKPWALYPSLFWEASNHQTLCQTHHNRKTMIDGSYTGNRPSYGNQ